MNRTQVIRLVIAVLIIVGSVYALERLKPPVSNQEKTSSSEGAQAAQSGAVAPEIERPSGFINTDGLQIHDLVGQKVILVDFWTYSCINCQRTLPYLTDWYKKYGDQGLEIVGVHTPEFDFEKKYDNVAAAVKKFGITYPVVLDNDYATWQAYGNHYWPHEYLIDINGNIVHDHIGEGGYAETEQMIQSLLQQRSELLGENLHVDTMPLTHDTGGASQADSPETYFGSARNEYLANGETGKTGTQSFIIPDTLESNKLYLGGTWKIQDEYAETAGAGASVKFRYQARSVYMVARSDTPVHVMVRVDGKMVKEIVVQADQLYTLVDDTAPGEHTLELLIADPGLQAFTLTFG